MKTQLRGMVILALVLVCANFFLPSSSCLADTITLPAPPDEADKAAAKGKNTLQKLVEIDVEVAPILGFHSADEATDATMKLGRALPIMGVHIDRLKSYTSEQGIASLFKPTNQFIYPVIVEGKVRSAITVRKSSKTGQWHSAFGAVGAPMAAEQLNVLDSAFIVRLYAMERWFLGTPRGNKLTVIPISRNPAYKKGVSPERAISIGKEESAHDAFMKLAEEAKKFDFTAYKRRHSHTK